MLVTYDYEIRVRVLDATPTFQGLGWACVLMIYVYALGIVAFLTGVASC